MGKGSKIGIVFAIMIVLIYSAYLVTSGEIERMTPTSKITNDQPTSLTNDQPKEKSYMMMSDFELNQIKIDWQYRDLLRNIDDYIGKIIFVEGLAVMVFQSSNELELCTSRMSIPAMGNPFSCAENDFRIKLNGNDTWLDNDILYGYVEIIGLDWKGDVLVKEIRLTCSNC